MTHMQRVLMNIFWLAPQFCLPGLMEGLAVDGLDDFSIYQFPDASWKDYVWAVNKLAMGIGSFLSIFSVYTNRSLFTRILNSSRLDEYYKRLFNSGLL
ncbi:hypothetical protein Pint_25226 [Pistacia integerrima]|uniref:Uncharacterized protein n=1 Tax=Pistacia integerrima TaxID=434235 RepID=A0ACC0YFD5_9ROSI|nr:hypothetical protein Pint_25226 [Pistacia integerrima]